MINILENLPNSCYSIAIDERGIVVEGRIDPLYKLNSLKDLVYIWNMSDIEIDQFFKKA